MCADLESAQGRATPANPIAVTAILALKEAAKRGEKGGLAPDLKDSRQPMGGGSLIARSTSLQVLQVLTITKSRIH